jgi:hypothetical protein
MTVSLIFAVVAWAAAPGVSPVLGDASMVAGYVPSLDGLAPEAVEQARVRGHLRWAHDLLAAADTSQLPPGLRIARSRNLARLARYAEAGVFPRNDDHPDARRPTFIDARGRICAVGALFEHDRGHASAERIARDHKYALIAQIGDPELAAWQRTSGFTLAELAMIQPAYGPPDNEPLWTPFGLLDRMQLSPSRFVATTEFTWQDSTALTLHAQGLALGARELRLYATLPIVRAVGAVDAVALATADPAMRTRLGAAELGVFGAGSERTVLWRFGIVGPTSGEEPYRFPSARVGDAVLGLPRNAGGRISLTKLFGPYPHARSGAESHSKRQTLRLDLGVDAGFILDDRPYVIPRAGLGFVFAQRFTSLAFETAIARAPSADGDDHVRWSAGVTGRLVKRKRWWDNRGPFERVQPAITVATVRTIESWATTLSLELAFAARAKDDRHD